MYYQGENYCRPVFVFAVPCADCFETFDAFSTAVSTH